MKVLLVNGAPHEKGCTYTALCEVEKELKNAGIETEIFWLGNKQVRGCIGCGKCAENDRHCIFTRHVAMNSSWMYGRESGLRASTSQPGAW